MNVDSFAHLSNQVLQELKDINDTLAIVGILYISKTCISKLVGAVQFLKTHFLSKLSSADVKSLCGGEWAVVTGSSDGIGRAYAEELAARGLHIILISNEVRPLQTTAIEINEKYGVQVDFICMTIDGDASKYAKLRESIEGKAIGVLVNNVGAMYDYPQMFTDVTEEKLWQLINVNIAATTMMTHMILPQMVERRKGAIVNVSAGACSRPTPQMTVYTATKAYIDLFSRSLDYEYRGHGITIQSLTPFYVATRMHRYYSNTKPSRLIPTAQEYARHAIQTLGYSNRTTGYWLHTIQGWIAHLFPEWLWMWGATHLNNALRKQAQERIRSRSFRSLTDSASSQ